MLGRGERLELELLHPILVTLMLVEVRRSHWTKVAVSVVLFWIVHLILIPILMIHKKGSALYISCAYAYTANTVAAVAAASAVAAAAASAVAAAAVAVAAAASHKELHLIS